MAASSNLTSPFFMLASSPPSWKNSMNKSKICLQQSESSSNKKGDHQHVTFTNLDRNLKIKLQAQALHNGHSRLTSMVASLKDEDKTTASAKMEHLTFEGKLIKGGLVFQQNHFIRSFELSSEYRVSTTAIMNFLQEASFNARTKTRMSTDTFFDVTPEMSKRDLIWVFRSMSVEVDLYPSWADIIQVDHWCCASGRTGMRLDWIISDIKSGETLVRASCLAVMMNKNTRKACKVPEEVNEELKPFLTTDAKPIIEEFRNSSQEVETMNYIRNGLTPGWHDLDFNYHVNYAKYLDWILESAPRSLIYSHELCTINMEYRKECLKDDVVQSLSRVVNDETDLLMKNRQVELQHVVRLESGPEVVRARTVWRPKSFN